jgi:DNA-binding transcriptional LysR family regulator
MLRGFEAAARHLNFTEAASELCLTPSAVSRQMQTLEAQLGAPLFLRRNRKLELTGAGQALYDAVRGANALIESAVAEFQREPQRPEVVVKAAGPFASCWLVPRLPRFALAYPDCSVRIETTHDISPVADDECDLSVRHFPDGAAPRGAVRLADDAVLPVCTPALRRDAARPLRRPRDLAGHVLIEFALKANNRATVDWFCWCKKMRIESMVPRGTLSFSSYDQVLRAALDGVGVALGRLPLVLGHLREGLLEAPLQGASIVTGAWYAVPATPRLACQHARAFLDWLRAESERDLLLGANDAAWAASA